LDPKACYTLQEKLWPFYPAPKENKFVISKQCQHFHRPKIGGGGGLCRINLVLDYVGLTSWN
jgi:hypothetical protein